VHNQTSSQGQNLQAKDLASKAKNFAVKTEVMDLTHITPKNIALSPKHLQFNNKYIL